ALPSGVSGPALLAAVFLVAGAVGPSAAARRTEIALLRCAGARRRDVVALLLGEALLTGLAGAALGAGFGVVLARALVASARESTALVFSLATYGGGLRVSGATLVLGAAAGMLAAL